MTNQSVNSIMSALVSRFTADIPTFKLVRQGILPTANLAASELPALQIQEGPEDPTNFELGVTDWYRVLIGGQIITKGTGDVDTDLATIRSLMVQVKDSLHGNIQLGGAALKCTVAGTDAPIYFVGGIRTAYHFQNFTLAAEYRRDRS